jgi:hypothetical protein
MKTNVWIWISLFTLTAFLLSGCSLGRNRNQNGSNPADTAAPAMTATQVTELQVLAQATPTAEQAQPTQIPEQVQPTQTPEQTVKSSADVSQAADELSKELDGVLKDLDATDTLSDVK